MAQDRFVWWDKKRPTRKEVALVLRQFFGEAAKEIKWDDAHKRFDILLMGNYSDPLEGLGVLATPADFREPRWIEVIPSRRCLDVITRMADDYTNSLATGLAEVFARRWWGKLED